MRVRIELVDAQRVDGLCEACWLPSLIRYTMAYMNDVDRHTPSGIGSRLMCLDCGHQQD